MNRLFHALNGLLGAAFLLSAVVQYNDPDPARWMLIYGLAAAACVVAIRAPTMRLLPGLVLVAATVWCVTLVPEVVGQVGFGELFDSVAMKTLEIEQGRELGGLSMIGAWMLVLVVRGWRL